MATQTGLVTEIERVKRVARLVDDVLSRELLKRYLRDIEGDRASRPASDGRGISI